MSKNLVDIALKSGAPLLAQILRGFGPIGSLAGGVIDAVAGQLGTDPTPEAIEKAHRAEPERVETVIRQVDTDYAEIARSVAETTQSWHRVLEGDRQADSWMTRNWRPLTAILFGPAALAIVMTACAAVLWRIAPDPSLSPLFALAGTTVSTWAGFCGWYAHKRTLEKKD